MIELNEKKHNHLAALPMGKRSDNAILLTLETLELREVINEMVTKSIDNLIDDPIFLEKISLCHELLEVIYKRIGGKTR